jgi:hypothetical protein
VVVIALIGWILLTPLLSKWLGTGLTLFVLTPVLSRLLTLALGFNLAGERLGGLLADRLRRIATGDRRWSSSLILVVSKENIIFGDDGGEQMIKVSSLETLRCVALVKLKDRLGDQRGGGGSEWEPIKILLKELGLCPNRNSKCHTRTPIAKTM